MLLTYCVPGAMTGTNMFPPASPQFPAKDLKVSPLFLPSFRTHRNTRSRQMNNGVLGMAQVRRVWELSSAVSLSHGRSWVSTRRVIQSTHRL